MAAQTLRKATDIITQSKNIIYNVDDLCESDKTIIDNIAYAIHQSANDGMQSVAFHLPDELTIKGKRYIERLLLAHGYTVNITSDWHLWIITWG